MRLYIAGPYTDDDPDRVARNVEAADAAARELARRGHVPLCMHKMLAGWEHDARFNYETFMWICRAWLERCDALLLVDGWRRSMGAQRELDWARQYGLVVYSRIEDVPDVRT